ncbi:MAG: hypothetical protein GY842_00465 [bacterium]|nr:hypothetical protein [bacterium]
MRFRGDQFNPLPVIAILVLAAAIRLVGLGGVPPALLPDEASNAYDAYCLLETGQDRWGQTFPLLLEAFGRGDHRPALYAYLVVPWVALLGPEHLDIAVRVPAALGGVLTVLGLFLLVGRVADWPTALWAALLLTLCPWHIRISRFGHESALTPLFPVVILLLLSHAKWPLRGSAKLTREELRLRWAGMVACGLMAGLSAHAYASLRLFIPLMLLVGGLIYRDAVRAVLRSRVSRRALAAGLVAFAAVVAPMAWQAWTHWAEFSGRAEHVSLFHQGGSVGEGLWKAAGQYAAHFSPTWLLVRGDASPLSRTPGVGQLNWYMLPLGLMGLGVLWRQRGDRVSLMVLAWLVLHPAASALCTDGPHTARAACGIAAFAWVGGLGARAVAGSWRGVAWRERLIGLVLLAAIVVNGGWALRRYAVYARHPAWTPLFQTDLRAAVDYLRGRWEDYDRIFVSDHTSAEHRWGNEHPYILVLTYLPVAPADFHAWEKEVAYLLPEQGFHYVKRAGPFTFSTRPDALAEQFEMRPGERVIVVGRPGDIRGGRLLTEIRDGRGAIRFEVVEVGAAARNPPLGRTNEMGQSTVGPNG